MRPAAERLRDYLAAVAISTPQMPVIQNADVLAHQDAIAIKDALVRQLYSPVRWIDTVRNFAQREVGAVIECGPGKVLGGLTKRIDGNLQSMTLHDTASLRNALTQL